MRKIFIGLTGLAMLIGSSAVVVADSSNGEGDGKGRTGPAEAVSAGKGDTASVARGLTGGWGSAGGVSNDNGRDAAEKGDPPRGRVGN